MDRQPASGAWAYGSFVVRPGGDLPGTSLPMGAASGASSPHVLDLEARVRELEWAKAMLVAHGAAAPSPAEPVVTSRGRVLELEARVRDLEGAKEDLERKLNDNGRRFVEAFVHSTAATDSRIRELLEMLERVEREKDEEVRAAREGAAPQPEAAQRQGGPSSVAAMMRQFTESVNASASAARREANEAMAASGLAESRLAEAAVVRARGEEGREAALVAARAALLEASRERDATAALLGEATERVAALEQERAVTNTRLLSASEAVGDFCSLIDAVDMLKGAVTTKDNECQCLRSRLDIAERRLRLADTESAMLRSELEACHRVRDVPLCTIAVGEGRPY
mmetsp:Transcript_50885/g.143242  ORF Transcript_50885/g.143242 Transcript_50885/m.143242 type:complete len:341 (+) Transcript_50885:83-1105(+)